MANQKIFLGIFLSLISCTLCKVAHYSRHHYKGAKAAHIEDFPFMVSIQTKDIFTEEFSHNCGGSLIDPLTVLTAGNCVIEHLISNMRVVAGISNLKFVNSGEIFNVSESFVHEDYPGGVSDNDIGILILETPIRTISDYAILPATTGIDYSDAILIGWEIDEYRSQHKILHKIKLPVLKYSDCVDSLLYLTNDTIPYTDRTNICTSNVDGHVCPGDSGGPLIQNGIVVGIVSWIAGHCGNFEGIVIFTRVNSFLNFINNIKI